MPKIKNQHYRKFIDQGIINILTTEQLKLGLKNVTGIRGKFLREGRAMLIFLYWSGARPIELFAMRAKDLEKDGNYLTCFIPTAKRGRARKIYISLHRMGITELYNYSRAIFPGQFMFYHYKSTYTRLVKHKSGKISEYEENGDRLRYYINKWFKNILPGSIPPYYFRHSRLSSLSANGATRAELKFYKGAKDGRSVDAYEHISQVTAKSLSKKTK